jgi:hypothetical protein
VPTRRIVHLLVAVVALCALAAAGYGILELARSQGVGPTGDEPHYLVAALGVGRYHTLEVGSAYKFAVAHSSFIHWPSPPVEQAVHAHGGTFAYHEPGLPILLAPGVALAGLHGAYATLIGLAALLTVWLCHLAGRVSEVRSPWRFAVAGIFLSPAYLLASSAVYPDLVSGLLIAIVVLTIADIETSRRATWPQLVSCGIVIGYLPWLHIQNALFAALLVVGLFLVNWWNRSKLAPLLVALVVAAGIWALMGIYDWYVFGRPQGPPGQAFSWGELGWTRVLALFLDRQQGLLVQFPVIVLAFAALWALRRRIPLTALCTVAVSAAVLVVSGASGNSFGGQSFVGRFNWTLCPVLLAFAGVYLLQLAHRRMGAAFFVSCSVLALYALQLAVLLHGDHTYYSMAWLTPQTPAGPAWWGPFDHLLPSFAQLDGAWRSTKVVWGVFFLVCLCGLLSYVAAALVQRSTRARASVAGVLLVASAVTLSGTAASASQRAVPMVFDASTLSSQVGHVSGTSRIVSGPHSKGALVYGPYWTVPSGVWTATFYYSLDDKEPGAASADVHVVQLPSGSSAVLAHARLTPSRHAKEVLEFEISHRSLLEMRVFWMGRKTLRVDSVQLQLVSPL